jgi:hypothetical protein
VTAVLPVLPVLAVRPGRTRRRLVVGFAAVMSVLALTVGFVGLGVHDGVVRRSPAGVLRAAAAVLVRSPAVRLVMATDDGAGRTVAADVVVTSDKAVSGTVTDPEGGRAEIVEAHGDVAVNGDRDWWARRAPGQVSVLTGRWVRPHAGVGFPVDIGIKLNPAALAALVTAMSKHVTAGSPTAAMSGTPGDEDGAGEGPDGRPAQLVTAGGWSALVTTDVPRRLVWLAGPVRDGAPTAPAVAQGGARPAEVDAPVWRTGGAGSDGADTDGTGRAAVRRVGDSAAPPAVWSVEPTPAGGDAATAARTAAARVLSQPSSAWPSGAVRGTGPFGSAAPSAPAAAGPPEQDALVETVAVFEVNVQASDCRAPTCDWSVTVTNVGTAAGTVTVYAAAPPGMPVPQSFPAGMLQPGATSPPRAMTIPNPAWGRGPGTRVLISYQAWTISDTDGGVDPAVSARLAARRTNITKGPLARVDKAYQPTITNALDQMTRHTPATDNDSTDKAIAAAENAVKVGLLPELRAIIDSGRLQNPEALIKKLSAAAQDSDLDQTDQDGGLGYRREIETVAEILRNDPTAVLVFDAPINVDGKQYKADILDTHNRRAYQIKINSDDNMVKKVNRVVKQLLGQTGVDDQTGVTEMAPPGYRTVAIVRIEPSSTQYDWDQAGIERTLKRTARSSVRCGPNGATVDEIAVVNGTGVHRWTRGGADASIDGLCQ